MELVPNLQAKITHCSVIQGIILPERDGVCVCVCMEKGDLLLHNVADQGFEYWNKDKTNWTSQEKN